MDKTLLLSLSLTLLLFVSSSVAQQQQQNQCDINNLDALEPSNRVEYEGGIVETWNPNHQQFKCAGTAMMRVTMHPKAIITPLYSPAPVGVFVVQGEGLTSVAIPGCPPTFQSPARGSGEGSMFSEQHQKIERFQAGDFMAVPAGIAHWWYNNGDKPVVLIRFIHLANPENQLDTYPRIFHLTGNPVEDEFQERGQSPREKEPWWGKRGRESSSTCNNVLCGFDREMLAAAMDLDEDLVDKLQNNKDNRGGLVKARGGFRTITPPRSQRSTSTEETEGNGMEETLCTMKLLENVEDPSRADVYTPGVGRLTSLNSHTLPILRHVQLSFERGDLYDGSYISPHWTTNAHKVVYAIRGSARVQVTDNSGNRVFDGELSQGKALVIPQNFMVMAKARSERFSWVTMKTNNDAVEGHAAGQTSVFLSFPEDVIANSFGISREEARRLKRRSLSRNIFTPGKSSQREMKADA